jgi:hypothetical protein
MINTAKKTYATRRGPRRQAIKEIEKAIADPAHLKQLGKQSSCIPTDFASVLSKYMIMSSDPQQRV